MGKKVKATKKANKNGLSVLKKRNIRVNKLHKQGFFRKESLKRRRKEKKGEERMAYRNRLEIEKQEEEKKEQEPEPELTGEDMIEMIEKDDLDHLLKQYRVEKKGKPANENQRRTFKEYGEEEGIKDMLPVLTEDGWKDRKAPISKETKELLLSNYKRVKKGQGEEEEEEEEEAEEKDSGISGDEEEEEYVIPKLEEENKTKSVAQIWAGRQRVIKEMKINMGCLATNLLEDPTKMSNLRRLLEMFDESNPAIEVTINKYAAITLLQVFHDLIPSYRVQENMLGNSLQKVKLKTAKMEMELLKNYRQYLKSLENNLERYKTEPKNPKLAAMSEVSLHCLGDLLVRHPQFNYSLNIVQALIPYLNNSNKKFRTLAYEALAQVIKTDKSCISTLEIVRKVYKLTHRLRFRVRDETFKLFLSLRSAEMKNLDSVYEASRKTTKAMSHKEKLIHKLVEQAKKKPSRKQKRENKKMAKIRDQMAEINTEEISNIQNSKHSEILKTVFGLYFHVLKNKPKSKLMAVVLEGLAKFSHLINVEFFSDLLSLMNQFLEEGVLGTMGSLHCIKTVFNILSGQGESLNIDPLRFYNQFYCMLASMNQEERESNLETILKILDQMLMMRRNRVSAAKVQSFAKRLANLSLTLPHQFAIPVLVSLKKILTTFSTTDILLETDLEGSPSLYLPEVADPEHANASSTALFEMIMTDKHYHPTVKMLSANILSGIPARKVPMVHAVTRRSIEDLLNDFGCSELKFNPVIPSPEDHLTKKKRKASRRVFVNGSLDLENLKLQCLCEKAMAQDDSHLDLEPPNKKSRKDTLSFYDSLNRTQEEDVLNESSAFRKVKDFTSQFVDLQ